jgi:hypothetical protein
MEASLFVRASKLSWQVTSRDYSRLHSAAQSSLLLRLSINHQFGMQNIISSA